MCTEEAKKEDDVFVCTTELEEIFLVFLDVDGVLNPTEWEQHVVKNRDKHKHGRFELSKPHLRRIRKLFETMGTNCKLVLSTSWRLEDMTKNALISQLTDSNYIDANNSEMKMNEEKKQCNLNDECNWSIYNHIIDIESIISNENNIADCNKKDGSKNGQRKNKSNKKRKKIVWKGMNVTQTRDLQPVYPRICEIYDFIKNIKKKENGLKQYLTVKNWICIDDNDLYCDNDMKGLTQHDIDFYQIESKQTFYQKRFVQTKSKIGLTDDDVDKAIALLQFK